MVYNRPNIRGGGRTMEPKIFSKESLLIAGVTGDGNETGKLWDAFSRLNNAGPLSNKASEDGYEIRVYEKGECECHVGLQVKDPGVPEVYKVMSLAPSMYAEFEIYPAQGYAGQNEVMNKWLSENANLYRQARRDGKLFSVLVYDARFKGNNPESVVGCWVPLSQIEKER